MPSRHDISHTTVINAPIDKVWEALIDIHDWKWNLWTRLEATEGAKTGVKGKLKACYNGDDAKWETFDFEFGEVSETEHLLTWCGNVGPGGSVFRGHHTMQLSRVDDTTTTLEHKEVFGGMLPALGFGLPYKKLNENYLKMNEALKKYVEDQLKN